MGDGRPELAVGDPARGHAASTSTGGPSGRSVARPRPSERRSRRWWPLGATVVVIALWSSAARPASAHGFTVVVVTSPSADSEAAARGFARAVDQSPDVSHAPGPDAGDHLGGVDVELVALGDGESSGTADRVGDLLDAGASAVVVLFVPSTVDGIAAVADERDKLALVVGDEGAVSAGSASLLLRPLDVGDADEADVADATAVYRELLGEAPQGPTVLGYDAGRLLDAIVSEVGDVLEPGEAVLAAALAADDGLTLSRVVEPGVGSRDRGGPGGDRGDVLLPAAVAAAALLGIGAGVVVVRRSRRRARRG